MLLVQPVQPLLFWLSAPAPPPPLPKRASKSWGPAARVIGPVDDHVAGTRERQEVGSTRYVRVYGQQARVRAKGHGTSDRNGAANMAGAADVLNGAGAGRASALDIEGKRAQVQGVEPQAA